MKLPRLVGLAALGLCFLAAPAGAKVEVTQDGACGFKITFNLQFYGPGGDSAFAQKVHDQVINCWKGHKVDCCPVAIDVKFLVGGSRTAGYDSIYVYQDPAGSDHVDDHISCCRLGSVNSGDTSGAWDTNEPPETYAHEVGHLAGLPDTYKTETVEKVVNGKTVSERKTTPCEGHGNDKMATLSGKIPQETVESLIKTAGLSCPKECWPTDASGGKADAGGTASPPGPQKRPSEGRTELHFNFFPSGSIFRFYRATNVGGDSLIVPSLAGFMAVRTDTIPPPSQNPLWMPGMAGIVFSAFQMTLPSFEWSPGVFTGPNQLLLFNVDSAPGMEIFAPHGHVDDVTGQFSGFLPLQLQNALSSPGDPLLLLSVVTGVINWNTGNVQVHVDLSPILRLSTVSGVPALPVPELRPPIVLSPSYPNPFLGSTTIRFTLRQPGAVTIRIFDAGGRLIRTLAEGLRTGGLQEVAWDGRDDRGRAMSAGIYYYGVSGLGARVTQRVVLLR